MVTDPIANFIISLKNGSAAHKDAVLVPHSKLVASIAEKLHEKGFIKSLARRSKKERRLIEIELRYEKNGTPRIQNVTRLSKPGRRLYEKSTRIVPVRRGKGAVFLSTPAGILTGEEAKEKHVGGEMLFKIW